MASLLLCLLPALVIGKSLVPKAMLGDWGGVVTTSPLGPRAGGDKFVRFSEGLLGDFYMRHSYDAQLFRMEGDRVEYCFSYDNPQLQTTGADRAPFKIVPSDDENELKLCWTRPRLPSHRENCTGCDCAQLTMRVDGDTLTSVFLQSPPAVHMNLTLKRTGPAPLSIEVIDGWNCQFSDSTGRVIPNKTVAVAHSQPSNTLDVPSVAQPDFSGQVSNCAVLNLVHDVRLEYVAAKLPCMPCDVTFTVSAPVAKGSYVALGFKENYAAYYDYDEHPREIPNYWGMATSDDNATELAGHIMVGYTADSGKSCTREMRANAYVGSVVDVPSDGLIQKASVTTTDGRTTLKFTASIHAGKTAKELAWYGQAFGRQRIQWATGLVGEGDACSAPLQYHFGHRASASLDFPGFGTPCQSTEAMLTTDMNIAV